MFSKKRHIAGFTLIELLIVVVVIAILSSIAIVSYTGMQSRAIGVRMVSALDVYEKQLRLYKEANGAFPSTYYTPPGGGSGYYAIVCLGVVTDYPAKGAFDEGKCANRDTFPAGFNGPDYAVSPSLVAALKTVSATSPKVGDISFTKFLSTPTSRGILYQGTPETAQQNPGSNAPGGLIYYYLDGDQPCGRGSKQTMRASEVWPELTTSSEFITVCQIILY